MVRGHFLPLSSEIRAQSDGLDAKPSTYRVVPRDPTSVPTPKALLALLTPGAKMVLFNETMEVPEQTNMEVKSLSCKDG